MAHIGSHVLTILLFAIALASALTLSQNNELLVLGIHAVVLSLLLYIHRLNILPIAVFVVTMCVALWTAQKMGVLEFKCSMYLRSELGLPLWIPVCWAIVGVFAWYTSKISR